MKKIFIIIVLFMKLGSLCYASSISQQWIGIYGGSERDIISCIQQTMDGGYIATGTTESFVPGLQWDLLVLKIDTNGNVSWQKTYHYYSLNNIGDSIQQTTDGGYIVAGATASMSFAKGWILKLDSNGDIIWQKTYDDEGEFKKILQTTDGGYVATGGGSVLKINSEGIVLWWKKYWIYPEFDAIEQTTDEGYILTAHIFVAGSWDAWILKLDSSGDIVWQKSYGNESVNNAYSIKQTSDGGYVVAGQTNDSAMVLKLNADGEIFWQKKYQWKANYAVGINQTEDGGYTVVGSTSNNGWDIFILHLDNSGNIIWQKSYGGLNGDYGVYYGKSIDGGTIVAGNTLYYGSSSNDLMMLKLDSNGEVPDCDIIHPATAVAQNAGITSQETFGTVQSFPISVTDTDTIPQDVILNESTVCYYEDPNDSDGDGITTILGGAMASSTNSSSFLAEGDNCSDMPNGPYLGTCISGKVGSTCIANVACGVDGICSMNQEDTYPPQGNSIGDACDCEGNFSCSEDQDVDGTDAATFKTDFGRSQFQRPCTSEDTCNGDFSCDGDVDGTDAARFKQDFGRSQFSNPCPTCTQGVPWCVYP